MEIIEELYLIVEAFVKKEIPHALCGGLAVAIHGRPRMTVDIDFVVASDYVYVAAEAAAEVGFDDVTGWITLPRNDSGIDRLYRINKIEESELLTLDLLELDSAEDALLADCQVFELEGRRLFVLSRSSLIKMKQNTGRTQDKLDIEILSDEAE